MTILSGVLLLAAVLLWLALIATSATLNSSDPAGNALSSAYGAFIALGLWAVLALMLIIAGAKGVMPLGSRLAALVLVPASCAATLAAMNLMSGHPGLKWPLALPILAPPLILAYAIWSYFPGMRAMVPATYAATGIWGLLLVLTLIPLPAIRSRHRDGLAQRERVMGEQATGAAQEREAREQENLANFQRLTAESRLWDLIPFTGDSNALREQALERARSLATRQADAEQMLAEGQGFPLLEVQSLNLAPTPGFCEKAAAFLIQQAKDWRPTVEVPPPYETRAGEIEQYLGAMGWLRANGCDINAALLATEASVRSYPAGPGRELFLEALGRLRAAR